MTHAQPRILTISNFFDSRRGGVEIVAGRLARMLSQQGFDLTWLATGHAAPACFQDSGSSRPIELSAWNGIEDYTGTPVPLPTPSAISSIIRAVKASDVLLMHDSLYVTNIIAFVASRWLGKPVVLVQHIGEVPFRNRLLRTAMKLANWTVTMPMLRAAEQVVFISDVIRNHFTALGLRRPSELLFNGLDTDVFRLPASEERLGARARFGFSDSECVALFVGRFVEKKGLRVLERAAAMTPDFTWAFAGWGSIDPSAWDLSNVCVFEGLSGAQLAELYWAADVFVLPSQGEGFPLVIQEALACGLPVVCGAESTLADPSASTLLRGVDLAGKTLEAAATEVVDAVMTERRGNSPMLARQRQTLAHAQYAWSRSADRYAEILRAEASKAAASA